jgi:hypothetical protein
MFRDLAILHRGGKFSEFLHQQLKDFSYSFFSRIFLNLEIHSKNVLMQHKIELIEKYLWN